MHSTTKSPNDAALSMLLLPDGVLTSRPPQCPHLPVHQSISDMGSIVADVRRLIIEEMGFEPRIWAVDIHMQPCAQMASPAVKICSELARLSQDYTAAVLRHTQLRSERIFAVIKGLESPSAIELIEAEIQKNKAKIALLAHQKEHGCERVNEE